MAELPPREAEVIPVVRRSPGPRAERRFLPSLAVEYYSRMRRQRVYPLVVHWGKDEGQSPESVAVVVRPLIPGALVVPAEATLDPRDPAKQATFHVTPLARGRLLAAAVEVQHQGRELEAIPLRIMVPRQLLSWLLLILAFVVPWLMLLTTGKNELKSDKITYASEEEKKSKSETRPLKPGEALADRLNLAQSGWHGVTDKIADGIGEAYQLLCDQVRKTPQLPLYVGAGLLALAILSWLVNPLSRRARARSNPLTLRATG